MILAALALALAAATSMACADYWLPPARPNMVWTCMNGAALEVAATPLTPTSPDPTLCLPGHRYAVRAFIPFANAPRIGDDPMTGENGWNGGRLQGRYQAPHAPLAVRA